MRKFAVQSKKDGMYVYELEVEVLTAMQDPSVMWLKPGEYKARILKPDTFHMKRERVVDSKREVYYEPDVWHSHALYDSKEEATAVAMKLVQAEFDFNYRKYGTVYTNVEIAAAMLAIMFVKLTA